jgi:hypothetical protein
VDREGAGEWVRGRESERRTDERERGARERERERERENPQVRETER